MVKSEIARQGQATPPADLTRMSTEQLRAELARQLKHTAESLLRTAWTVRLLEERGEDLSDLRIGLLSHLRRIAYGQVLPELVVRFASAPMVLQRVSLLPLPDQRRLADGGTVELVVARAGDGGKVSFDKRQADPLRLGRDQLWQVFGPDRVRSEAEQTLYLEERAGKPQKRPAPTGLARPDRTRGGLLVGRTFVGHAEVLRALADLRGEAGGEPSADSPKVPVSLTEEEHRALKVRSAQSGASMTDLIRDALRAAGLI